MQTKDPPHQFYGELVKTLTMPSRSDSFKINLLQLAVLLYTIGRTNDGKYHVMKMNCFWFARIVCQAIWLLATDAGANHRVIETIPNRQDDRMGKYICIRMDGSGSLRDLDQLHELVHRYRDIYSANRPLGQASLSCF